MVYAPSQNAFYANFARRMFLACRQAGIRVDLVSSDALHKLPPERIREASAVLVNPRDLIQDLPHKKPFYDAVAGFRSRIMVLAEAIETRWFSLQLRMPMTIDAFIDVGFISQESKMKEYGFSNVPYKFLFNGLSKQERERVAAEDPKENARRPIPWAFVGHKTIERVEFAHWLTKKVDVRGAIFLPDQGRGVRPGSGAISPLGMDLLLKKSKYYVWVTHHEFSYYESFRFREAVLNGAVPLKLDRRFYSEHSSVPGIVSGREALADFMAEGNYEESYEKSRAYYLDRKAFEDGMREVLLNEL